MSNITNNCPINPTRGGRADQMKRLEALFGGNSANKNSSSVNNTTLPGKANIEARFAAAFKAAPDASSDGTNNTGSTKGSDFAASLGTKAPSVYKIRLERIRNAKNESELNSAIETFLTSHELPNDITIILKVLNHPNESFVRKGLAELVGMISRKELMGSSMVLDALNNLATRKLSAETQSYIDGIRGMLAKN